MSLVGSGRGEELSYRAEKQSGLATLAMAAWGGKRPRFIYKKMLLCVLRQTQALKQADPSQRDLLADVGISLIKGRFQAPAQRCGLWHLQCSHPTPPAEKA